jgi:hypothetical protein
VGLIVSLRAFVCIMGLCGMIKEDVRSERAGMAPNQRQKQQLLLLLLLHSQQAGDAAAGGCNSSRTGMTLESQSSCYDHSSYLDHQLHKLVCKHTAAVLDRPVPITWPALLATHDTAVTASGDTQQHKSTLLLLGRCCCCCR